MLLATYWLYLGTCVSLALDTGCWLLVAGYCLRVRAAPAGTFPAGNCASLDTATCISAGRFKYEHFLQYELRRVADRFKYEHGGHGG